MPTLKILQMKSDDSNNEYDYDPQEDGEIVLKKGDICKVPKPIQNPLGWLEGTNQTSGEYGQFPGTFVKILKDYTPPPPPRPPKPSSKETALKEDWKNTNGHSLKKMTFTSPVWCQKCKDYIWGFRKQCFWCAECYCGSHLGCSNVFKNIDCDADKRYVLGADNLKEVDELQKPIAQWGKIEVLEWLATIRAYHYIHLFNESTIDGASLSCLSEERLRQEFSVKQDIHVRLIATAIKELVTGSDVNQGKAVIEEPSENFSDAHRGAFQSHCLREHTFTSLQYCDVCRKLMFGLVRQGYLCRDCGIQVHRPCAQYGLQNCSRRYIRARRSSDPPDPFFSQDLSLIIVKKCIDTVEGKGLDTRDIYCNSPDTIQALSLRTALNQEPNGVNINDKEWQDPIYAAHVLKEYLLELPVSVISANKYKDFIIAAKLSDGNSDIVQRLTSDLQSVNKSLLDMIILHLNKVSKQSESSFMTEGQLAKIFSIVLMRPGEEEIRTLVKNLDYQKKVIQLLICGVIVPPKIPPRPRPQSIVDTDNNRAAPPTPENNRTIEKADWYWGGISREEASEKLRHTREGSFLVRDSAKEGEYTLTLRKGESNKLIRIYYHRDGRFGFTETITFPSVVELVEHFQRNSLKEYNANLDIKLLYPISKPSEHVPVENNLDDLQARLEDVSAKLGKFTRLTNELAESSRILEDIKAVSDSQTEVIYFVEEQIRLAKSYSKEVTPNDRAVLQQSIGYMEKRLEEEKNVLKRADDEFNAATEKVGMLEAQCNDMKYEIPEIQREYDRLRRRIEELDPTKREQISELEDQGVYDQLPALQQNFTAESEELPEWSWNMENLSRADVRRMLEGKPDGTFLVRASERNPGTHVISLVHNNAIKHISIERGEHGYGFAEPHNKYKTLQELISHYHNKSLRMHNPHLDTCLQFPIKYFEDNDNVYQVADQI